MSGSRNLPRMRLYRGSKKRLSRVRLRDYPPPSELIHRPRVLVTAGPEWKIRRGKRFAPFAQALDGIVYTRSTFMMSGPDVNYTNPFTGGVDGATA
jgi:hypothetical protein